MDKTQFNLEQNHQDLEVDYWDLEVNDQDLEVNYQDFGKNYQNSDPNTYFPLTILAVSRNEYYGQDTDNQPLQLTIRDGLTNQETELPEDLQGHVFILSPVGSMASQQIYSNNPNHQEKIVWSSKDGWTPLYNGDGMIYRLSFQDKGATLKTRLMKPPCYYADQATLDPNKDYQELAFNDLGISRNSPESLGARNQVNTAFLPFKTPIDKHDRLLVTWDVGRPHELDPETLETLNPVGNSGDWTSMLPMPEQPFKQLMTSAHPCFAADENKVYTINVGKSLWTMSGLLRSIQARLRDNAKSLEKIEQNPHASKVVAGVLKGYRGFLKFVKFLVSFVAFFSSIFEKFAKHNFVHLLRWDGKQVDIEQRWNILLPGNKPLVIDQTVHQMGLTEKYLIIAESSFKFSLENTLPYQKTPIINSLKILLADLLDYPQFPSTKLYIVKREDLAKAAKKPKPWWSFLSRKKESPLPVVIAKEVNIKPEFSHYLVDYKNPHDRIILHASHLAASDIAECIRSFDTSYYDYRDNDSEEDLYDDEILTSRVQKLAGNVVGPMDASRLGCWIIDGETAEVLASDTTCYSEKNPDFPLTWATAFCAYLDEQATDKFTDKQATDKFTDIYWNSWGAWPDLLTTRAAQQYQYYPEDHTQDEHTNDSNGQREVPWEEVIRKTYKGIPSSLCHLKIDANAADQNNPKVELKIIDEYQFKKGNKHVLGTSAQFVPRPKPENPPKDYNPQTYGYIVCVVLTSDEFFSEPSTSDDCDNWSRSSELWIFDATNLEQGPKYKLSHPKMNFGFTVHTTWLKDAVSSNRIDYDVKEDFDDLVKELIKRQNPETGGKIRKLFDQEVYPHFSSDRN